MHRAMLALVATRPEDLLNCIQELTASMCSDAGAACLSGSSRSWLLASVDDDCLVKIYQQRPRSIHELGFVSPYSAAVRIECSSPRRLVRVAKKLHDKISSRCLAVATVLSEQ